VEVLSDMNFLRWIRSRFEMAPVNRVRAVNCEDEALEFRWALGSAAFAKWDDVQRVLIRTTDRGPFDDDVFLVMETSERRYVIPQTAVGAAQLLDRVQRLPGFDNEAVIESMGCTENSEFLCWERPSDPGLLE
jgi:hypothetical protein